MKLVIYILLCVLLLQYGSAKPVLSACETVLNENLMLSKQIDGDYEWNKIVVNFNQDIDACLKTNGRGLEQILIQFINLDNIGIVAEKQFDNYPDEEEVCMHFAGSTNYKNVLIKFIIKGEISKFDYIKLCQKHSPFSWPPLTDGWTIPTWPSTDSTNAWTIPTWPTTPSTTTSWTIPSWPATKTTSDTVIPSNWTPPSTVPSTQ